MEGSSFKMYDALAVALPEPSLDGLRRGLIGRAILATGLLSLVAGYVLPFAAEFQLSQKTRPVALESLQVPPLAFPALRVPKAVTANAHVALPVAPVQVRATTTPPLPHRHAQRVVAAPQRVRVPVVENTYVLVPQPKPVTTDDTSAPVYEESIGAMPDVMIDPATPDPNALAAAQAADRERIARLEADAHARAEATAAAEAQARAQAEAAAPAATASVAVTLTTPADTAPAPVGAASDDTTATPTATAPVTETITASSTETVASPAPAEIAPVAPAPTEAVVAAATPAPLPDAAPAPVALPETDPVPLPPVNESASALPIDPTVIAAPPTTEPATTVAPSDDGTTAVSAPSGDTQTATTAGGSTSATGSSATTPSDAASTAPADETGATAPDATITAGESVPPATARGPPAGATAISAADGGVAASADGGATVTFAPGALVNDVYVTVTPNSASAPSGVTAASPAYDLVAYDANGDVVERFGGAAELTIDYASATPPRIYYLSPTDGAIALDTRVDPAAHTVHAWLVHFSTYVAATPLDAFANRPPVTDVTVSVTVLAPSGTAMVDALVQGTSDTGYEVRGRTDAAGTISLGVSRGMWTFSAAGISNLQSATQAVDTTTGSTSYALALGLTEFPVYVTGTVRDADGSPLADVRVDARSDSGSAHADDFAISGADGGYRLGGLLGEWSISGQDLTDYYPRALESHYTPSASHAASLVVSGAATQDLTYALMPRQLTGNLRDQNGNGVAGAAVHLEVYSNTFDFHFSTAVISAGGGSYTARLPSDVFRVDIRAELQPSGYADLDVESRTWNAPSPDAGGAIVIPDFHYYKLSTSASGIVRDEPGKTVGDYTVAAEFYSALRARWFWIEATTDASGAWTISGDPGEWNVYPLTSIVGYSAATLRGLAVGPGSVTGVEVVLVAGAAVGGKVTFQDTGAAAAGVGIKACGFSCAVNRTNSLGEYLVWLAVDPQTRSSDGTVQMLTGKIGYARSSATIAGAVAGGSLVRDLLYVAFSTPYSGTVLDSFGTPVPGAVVRLSDGVDKALVTPQADGTWAGFGPADEALVSATGVFPTSGNSAVLIASAGATGIVLLLPATKLAGTVTDDLGTTLAGVTIDAERWLCVFGAANCGWADLFGSFYGQKLSTFASALTDGAGGYELTLDPALFSDNFPLRLAPQRFAGYLTPGRITPSYLPGEVTVADFRYERASIEIQGVADGAVYGHAVTPAVVTTPVFDAVEVTLNGSPWTPGEISADGAYTIVARALRSGAETARAAVHFSIDTIAPTVTVRGVADGGAYPADVTPDISVTDPNLAFTTITLDGATFAGGAVSAEGRHVLVVSASDWAANVTTVTVAFWVDRTAPTTTLTTNPAAGPFNAFSTFTLEASDDGSGVEATYWLLDAGPATRYVGPFSLSGLFGSHTLTWYAIDRAGNTEASRSATLAFPAPTAGKPDLRAESDTGLSSVDNITRVVQPTFNVTAAAGLLVELLEGTAVLGSAIAADDPRCGSSSPCAIVQVALLLADGRHPIRARARVNAPLSTPGPDSLPLTVTIDTVPPTAPVLDLPAERDSGASNTDNVTNVSVWPIYASLGDGDLVTTIEVTPAQALRPTDPTLTRVYKALRTSPPFVFFPDPDGGLGPDGRQGTWKYEAYGEDLAGNQSTRSMLAITFDSIAPAAPARPDLRTADDSGVSNTDNVTNVSRPGFDSTAESDALLVFYVDGSAYLGSALADGVHAVTADATDRAGNVSAKSEALLFTIDTVAPLAPTRPDLRAADDSGVFSDDDVTNVNRPHFDTTSDGDAALALYVDGVPYSGAADIVDGVHAVSATATDLAGNVAKSEELTVTIDTTIPAGTLALNDGAAGTRDPDVRAVPSFTDVLGPHQLRFSTDGGATWSDWQAYSSDLSVTLPGADGVKTVLVEVRDRAGNVGSASDAISLDRVGPVLTVTSPAAGAVLDVGQIVALVFSADDVSGIGSTSVTLDGLPLGGPSIDTLLLAVGTHTLVVTAVDTLGNVATSTVTFEVQATIAGLEAAVRRAAAAGLIDRREVQNLLHKLEHAAREIARGDPRDAAKALRKFAEEILEEAGRRVDRAFALRAAGWALELADRIWPRPANSRRGRR